MKKILSIDGGGIRGLIPALVLAEIEKRTGQPVAKVFDLVVGTSTGGILALGVAKNNGHGAPQYSAQQIAELYEKKGKIIFSRSKKPITSVGGFLDELYDQKGIESVLEEYFGGDLLYSAVVNAMVTCYDIEKRKPTFLKSWRTDYNKVLMRDAARATSAAPTFFEPAHIPFDDTGKKAALVDGGVFVNSPSVSAYAEAKRIFPDEELLLLSLGTGELTREYAYEKARNWGKLGWLLPLLSCMFDGMADAADYQMRLLLEDNYIRLQTELCTASDDMDDDSDQNIASLKIEAANIIKNHDKDLDRICSRLAG